MTDTVQGIVDSAQGCQIKYFRLDLVDSAPPPIQLKNLSKQP